MPIRLERTTLTADPAVQQSIGGGVAPFEPAGGAAAVNASAQVAGQAGALAARIYQQERDREIEAKVYELDTARLSLDQEAVDDYLGKVGGDAVEARASAIQRIDDNERNVLAQIGDREVRATFANISRARTARALQQVDQHYRAENLRHQTTTARDRRDLLLDDFRRATLAGGYDPATGALAPAAQQARSAFRQQVEKLGELAGADPDSVALALRQTDAQAFGAVADALLREGRLDAASSLLERHGERFDAEQRSDLQGRLQRARLAGEARDEAKRRSDAALTAALAPQRSPDGVLLAPNPDRVYAAAMDAVRRQFLQDGDAQVFERAAGNVKAYREAMRQQNAVEITQALAGLQQWVAEQPHPGPPYDLDRSRVDPADFPGRDALVRHGLEAAAAAYVAEPFLGWKTAPATMWDWRTRQFKDVPREQFYAEWRPRLDDWMFAKALAKYEADNGKQDPKTLRLLSDTERVSQWARRWLAIDGDRRLTPEEGQRVQRIMLGIERLASTLQETDLDAVLAHADRDIVQLGGVERAIASILGEQLEDVRLDVGGEQINPADISQDMQAHLTAYLVAAGALAPGQVPTQQQLAKAFVVTGQVRPLAGTTGETAGVGLAIVARETAFLHGEELLRMQREGFPGHVLTLIESSMRSGDVAVSPKRIRDRWAFLGRPQTPQEFHAAFKRARPLLEQMARPMEPGSSTDRRAGLRRSSAKLRGDRSYGGGWK